MEKKILYLLIALFGVSICFGTEYKLTASDVEADDQFGYSVSISGDYAIVGAHFEDAGGSDAGAAYIFYRNQGGENNWGEMTKLTASDAEAEDYFGWSVSISGDYAIVGAYWEDAGGSDAGAAYIFYRNQGGENNWGEVTKITASDASADDRFGWSVSISGDYAIVGAHYQDAAANNAGAAYIFYCSEGGMDNWGQVAKLTASDAEDWDEFGKSVSISGGYAIVGSYRDDLTGSAYIFDRSQGWSQVTKLTASDAQDWDYFGRSVSISGDYAIVGAYNEDAVASNAGAAYIFYRSEGGTDNWGQVTKLTASDAEEYDYFGCSVCINGDYAIVGAYGEDAGASNAGAAYSYFRSASSWNETSKTTASDAEEDDRFGRSVSISGDYAIVGAHYEDAGGSDAGAAYVYESIASGFDFKQTGTIVEKFVVHNNYPNPFNPETTICFDVPSQNGGLHMVKLNIYNSLGQLVTTLFDGEISSGRYEMKWNGANQPSGVYFLSYESGRFVQTQKMILIR